MDRTLVEFVKVLRTAELKVSPAETLDAMQCMDLVGYEDKVLLKNSLSMVLANKGELIFARRIDNAGNKLQKRIHLKGVWAVMTMLG